MSDSEGESEPARGWWVSFWRGFSGWRWRLVSAARVCCDGAGPGPPRAQYLSGGAWRLVSRRAARFWERRAARGHRAASREALDGRARPADFFALRMDTVICFLLERSQDGKQVT